MRSCSGVRRLLACRPDGGAQDAGDFPGLLQESRVLLNSTVLQVFQPVHALVSLFKGDMQLRSKRRARSALAGSSIIGPHRRCRSQQLTPGVLCHDARRQPTIEGQHGQREAAGSFDEIPGRHVSDSGARRVPRENVSKSLKYFRHFALSALSDFPSHFVLRTSYFLPGGRHA